MISSRSHNRVDAPERISATRAAYISGLSARGSLAAEKGTRLGSGDACQCCGCALGHDLGRVHPCSLPRFPHRCAVTVALPVLQALLAVSESCCGALGKAARYCYNYCLQSSARSLLSVFSFIFGWYIQTLHFNAILSVLLEPAPPAAVVCYEIVTFVLMKKMHANDGIQSIKGGKPPRHFVKLF